MKFALLILIPAIILAEKLNSTNSRSRRGRFVQILGASPAPIPPSAPIVNNASASASRNKLSFGLLFPFGLLNKAFKELLSNVIDDQDTLRVVSRICATAVWFTLGLSVAGSVGVDTKPIIGLSSAALLTIGWGARDLLANIFAGLFVVFARPFRRGSNITIHGTNGLVEFEGEVLAIDGRYLHLQKSFSPSSVSRGVTEQIGGTTLIPLSYVVGKCITVNRL